VSRCVGLSGSDRESPALTGRSGTQRARRLRSRTTVATSAPWSSSPPSELCITSVFSCVARVFKACPGFMFVGCCWWRSLAVDDGSGTSRGHRIRMRRLSSRRGVAPSNDRPLMRPGDCPGRRYRRRVVGCDRVLEGPKVAAVAVTVAVTRQPAAERILMTSLEGVWRTAVRAAELATPMLLNGRN
jgi:hypothetical protein